MKGKVSHTFRVVRKQIFKASDTSKYQTKSTKLNPSWEAASCVDGSFRLNGQCIYRVFEHYLETHCTVGIDKPWPTFNISTEMMKSTVNSKC
jgi:hypothetical protein